MNNADLQNQCHMIAEVTGSTPVSPTIAAVHIMHSIDPDYARRLEMRQMSNRDLFKRYDIELVLRLWSWYTSFLVLLFATISLSMAGINTAPRS